MADRRARGRAAGHRVTNVVGDHRANDLIYGHVGRLTYTSLEDDTSGSLHFNRITDQVPLLQEVSRFQTWYPGTKTDAAGHGSSSAWQTGRSQKAWLLKKLPEAFMGNDELGLLLSEETKAAEAAEKQGGPNLPLLSYGQITNITKPSRPTDCPALAMAVGESAHVLRIARLQYYNWRWAADESVSLRLGTADSTEEGHWCGDGLPIRQIKFATHRRLHDPTRWLLVQTATSTIVFEPELQKVPVAHEHSSCGYKPHGPSYISANPIMTLSMERTGACPHADVSFNPETNTRPPQLAIIDEGGNWSVWDIAGNRHARRKSLSPVLRSCGHFVNGPLAELPLIGNESREPHRIMWLASTRSTMGSFVAPNSPSTSSNVSSINEARAFPGTFSRRSDILLLCSSTALKTFNLEHGQSLRTLNMVRRNGMDSILDIQPCPVDPSSVFVLTTTTVFWLNLTSTGSEQRQSVPPDDLPGHGPVYRPTVLVSCPHFRDQADGTLSLSVAAAPFSTDRKACLVCIFSTVGTQITVFWFVAPDSGSEAMFHQQLFRFAAPGDLASREPKLETLLVIPRNFLHDADGDGIPGPGLRYAEGGFRFFQAVALTTSLELCSTLCVSLHQGQSLVASPAIREDSFPSTNRRRAVLEYFGDSFVVDDDFDERTILLEAEAKSQAKSLHKGSSSLSRPATVDLSRVVELLCERIKLAVHSTDRVNQRIYGEPLNVIGQEITSRLEQGQLPLATLLDIVDRGHVTGVEANMSDAWWAGQVPQLRGLRDEGLRIINLTRGGASPSPLSLYQMLYSTWYGGLREGVLDDAVVTRRRSLLDYIAIQVFLSQIGVLLVPQKLLTQQALESIGMGFGRPRTAGLPTLSDTESIAGSASRSDTLDENDADGEEQQNEDDTISRLRQYAPSIDSIPPRKEGESRLLSHWQLGSDPSEYWWSPTSTRIAAQIDPGRQRKRDEVRRRRREETMAASQGDEVGGPSTQPAPRIKHSSSQPRVADSQHSSQSFMPSQTMSQPLGGLHGARSKKQKVKKASGFR